MNVRWQHWGIIPLFSVASLRQISILTHKQMITLILSFVCAGECTLGLV